MRHGCVRRCRPMETELCLECKVRTWGAWGDERGKFRFPASVAAGADCTLYVADCNNHRIQCFGPQGAFLRAWGRKGSGAGEFRHPHGVAVSPDEERRDATLAAMRAVAALAAFPPGVLPLCAAYVMAER